MHLIYGNLFEQTDVDAICITTNGFVKKNGECVMGRGCAKEATKRYCGIAKLLGENIKKYGNRPLILSSLSSKPVLVSFPVKSEGCNRAHINKSQIVTHMRDKFFIHQYVPGWALVADKEIIIKSAKDLVEMTNKYEWKKVVLPRPGCGAGELNWNEVFPLLNKILDDRFYCITFNKK